MASGTISGGNYNSIYSYYMTWSSVSNGSVANTSNVTLNWIYKKNASDPYGAYNTSGSSKVTLVINGTSSGAMRADFDLRSASTGTTKTIATFTVNNIPHSSDGTLSINVSGSHTTGTSWGTKSIGSTSITLDTIPRYATCTQSLNSANSTETSLKINWSSDSTIDYVWYSKDNGSTWTAVGSVNATSGSYTISGLTANTKYNIKTRVRRKDSQLTTDSSTGAWTTYAYPYISAVGTSALEIGKSQTLTLYNPKGRSVTVYMKHNNTSGTQIYSGSTSTTSIQFTPTASTMYGLIPNAKSGNCVYYVVYSGNTSATKSGTFVVNETNNKPTVTSYTPYDNNSATYALTNSRATIVLNASNMQLTIVANAKNSATFNNGGYIKVNGTSLSLTISGNNATGVYTLNKPTSATYTITLQDSRGIQSGNISYTIPNYVNYFAPTIIGVAKRNQPTDGIINISGSGKFYNGSFGSQSNVLTVEYEVVEYGTTTQLDSGAMTASTSGNNHSESQIQVSNADYQKQWTVTFTVTDKLNSIQSIVQVTKGIPIFNWDNDEFDVNVQLNAKGLLQYGSSGRQDYSTAGFTYNQYGNMQHRGTSTSNSWQMMSYDGTTKVRIYPESGNTIIQGTGQVNGDFTCGSKIIIGRTASKGIYNSDDKPIIRDYGNQNVTVDATGSTLFLGYSNTTGLNILNGKVSVGSTGDFNNVEFHKSATYASVSAFLTAFEEFTSLKTHVGYCIIDGANGMFIGYHQLYNNADYCKVMILTTWNHYLCYTSGGAWTTRTLATTADIPTLTTGTGSATKTSGNANITAVAGAKYGKAVTLTVTFNTSGGTTAVGSNAWVGKITGVDLPKQYAMGTGYYSSTLYIGEMDSSGNLTIRVLGAQSASNSSAHRIIFSYVCA